jgi:hypothetical protein
MPTNVPSKEALKNCKKQIIDRLAKFSTERACPITNEFLVKFQVKT